MHATIEIQEVIAIQNAIIIDVRSEDEYEHAHIPNSISLPIFNNAERKIIGTTYKQESKEKAIKIGLKYFGSRMVKLVNALEDLHPKEEGKIIYVHCARGGMRSASMAWLFRLYGWQVCQIIGGYKSYRQWVLSMFERDYPLLIIGGATGTGKTRILHQLQSNGEAIIDLELLANHKGSAFGGLHTNDYNTQEQFENNFANELQKVKDKQKIFIEDESKRIGQVNIPNPFWDMMRDKKILYIEMDFEKRLENILVEYGIFDTQELIDATERIKKNLGGLAMQQVVDFLKLNDKKSAFEILLKYYDKYYQKGLEKREHWKDLMIPINGNVASILLIQQIINGKN